MIAHYAGQSNEGTLVVSEVWSSPRGAGGVHGRPAGQGLAEAGVPEPTKVTWVPRPVHRARGA